MFDLIRGGISKAYSVVGCQKRQLCIQSKQKTEGAKGLRRIVLPEYIMQLPSALQYNYCKAVVAILHVGMAQKQDDGNIQ